MHKERTKCSRQAHRAVGNHPSVGQGTVYSFNTIFTKLFRMAWVHRYKGLRAKAAGEGSELNAHLPVVPDCELELIRRNHQCRRMPTAIERLSRRTKKETQKAFSLMQPLNAPHGFSDDPQLKTVIDAAAALAPERRSVFLERCGAMLRMRRRFTDGDVADMAHLALSTCATNRR